MPKATCLVATIALLGLVSGCDPFGLPATRQLENGAAAMLSSAPSYEIKGAYSAGGRPWTIDMQLTRPNLRHVIATSNQESVEALIVGSDGYFRGRQFLADHLSGNPLAPSLVAAAGNGWWKDTTSLVPALPDFTDGATFKSTFLGTAVTQRTDHESVDGMDVVELSGARADIFIASSAPFDLVRIHLKHGVTVDGIQEADLHFGGAGRDFHIAAPSEVIDFGNFSTLPPIYTVLSVDTSGCGSPCVVAARVKNLGGLAPATGPSTVTFTMSDPASGRTLGSCSAPVRPDVAYNSTTGVSCTMPVAATNAAVVTATAANPGRA